MMNSAILNEAVRILREGGLVAFPTETVYGLGADATNPLAVKKIFAAKGRPIDHPVIVHLGDINQLEAWVSEVPLVAQQLAAAFWPGPLTLIMRKKSVVLDIITGGQDTVGIRMPHHPVAQALLKAFGGGVAAPSANRFGRISPTTVSAVREELGDVVDCILEGGQCDVGVESTIVDVSGERAVILRPGMITVQQIEAVLGEPIAEYRVNAPRVSGSYEAHYAPQTALCLVASDELDFISRHIREQSLPMSVLSLQQPLIEDIDVEWITMPSDPVQYAHDLYATLRRIDKAGFQQIVVEKVPVQKDWDAIRDRLQRASRWKR